MRHAGIGIAIALATTLTAEAGARADEPTMLFGTQFAVTGGASFPAARGHVDAGLGPTGWWRLPAVSPDAGIRFGLTGLDFTVDIHFGGFDQHLAGPDGSTGSFHRKDIGVDFGRSFVLRPGLRLAPFVGIGTIESTFCLHRTCASQDPVVVGLGLALPFTIWSGLHLVGPDSIGAGSRFTLGPKVSYAIDVDPSRRWAVSALESESDRRARGPVGPSGGGYAGVEAQYVFGAGKR